MPSLIRAASPRCLDIWLRTPRRGWPAAMCGARTVLPHTTAFRFPSVAGEFEGAVAAWAGLAPFAGSSVVAPPLPDDATQVDWAAGASVMMRTETLREIGLFDETFFLYFEETDLMQACRPGGVGLLVCATGAGGAHRLRLDRDEGMAAHAGLLVRLAPPLFRKKPWPRLCCDGFGPRG